ncbi:MAG: metallophosphoesterase family protein, partial [Chloroflexi bacterium]|nr:metallophosphoesterase family protein [Chloroflexota bacterium]
LSDIHGNPIALEAVLRDVQSTGGADLFLLLGDLVAIGYDSIGVLERIAALPNVCCVQGNTDRYVVTGERPYPSVADVQADPRLVSRIVEVAHSFAWIQGVIAAGGWFDWLAALPLEQRFDLPDGTRLLAVHVAPGQNDGLGIHPRLSDADLADQVANAAADLICVGHTHWPLDRTVTGGRVINSGNVSNPAPVRACTYTSWMRSSTPGASLSSRAR